MARHLRPDICGTAFAPYLRHDMGVAEVFPLVTRHLDPLASLELGYFVHLGLIDGHGAVLVADPKIDVVNLVLGADDPKVSAGEVMAVVELPHRLMGFDALELQLLAGLFIFELVYTAVFLALLQRVLFHGRHHFPTALGCRMTRVFGRRYPPP